MHVPDKIEILYLIGGEACDDELEIIFDYETIEDYYQNMSIDALRWFITYIADVDQIDPRWLWEVLGMEWLDSDDGDRIEELLYVHEDDQLTIADVHNTYPTYKSFIMGYWEAGGKLPTLVSRVRVEHYVDQLHDSLMKG